MCVTMWPAALTFLKQTVILVWQSCCDELSEVESLMAALTLLHHWHSHSQATNLVFMENNLNIRSHRLQMTVIIVHVPSSLTDYHWHSYSKKSCWEKWLVSLTPSDEIIFYLCLEQCHLNTHTAEREWAVVSETSLSDVCWMMFLNNGGSSSQTQYSHSGVTSTVLDRWQVCVEDFTAQSKTYYCLVDIQQTNPTWPLSPYVTFVLDLLFTVNV